MLEQLLHNQKVQKSNDGKQPNRSRQSRRNDTTDANRISHKLHTQNAHQKDADELEENPIENEANHVAVPRPRAQPVKGRSPGSGGKPGFGPEGTDTCFLSLTSRVCLPTLSFC